MRPASALEARQRSSSKQAEPQGRLRPKSAGTRSSSLPPINQQNLSIVGRTAPVRPGSAGRARRQTTCMQTRMESITHSSAESKQLAGLALQRAVEERSAIRLRAAIQRAWEAGVDAAEIGHGEEVLRAEEPKQQCLEHLAELRHRAASIAELRKAIVRAKMLQLSHTEYEDLEIRLDREEHSLIDVERALADLPNVDMSVLEDVQGAKDAHTGCVGGQGSGCRRGLAGRSRAPSAAAA